jgi:hypothetical protein
MRGVLVATVLSESSPEPSSLRLLDHILLLLPAFREPYIFVCRASETGGSMPRRACDEPLRVEGKRMG